MSGANRGEMKVLNKGEKGEIRGREPQGGGHPPEPENNKVDHRFKSDDVEKPSVRIHVERSNESEGNER